MRFLFRHRPYELQITEKGKRIIVKTKKEVEIDKINNDINNIIFSGSIGFILGILITYLIMITR